MDEEAIFFCGCGLSDGEEGCMRDLSGDGVSDGAGVTCGDCDGGVGAAG